MNSRFSLPPIEFFQYGLGFSALNTTHLVSTVFCNDDDLTVGRMPSVIRFMIGGFMRPVFSKYTNFWDVIKNSEFRKFYPLLIIIYNSS